MQGRLENKLKTEHSLQEAIKNTPDYMQRYYHSLNQKTHATKYTYIGNVLRFLHHKYGDRFPTVEELSVVEAYDIQIYMSEICFYYDSDGNLRELKESTQGAIYSSLAAFFKFICTSYKIGSNPFVDSIIERPKVKEKPVVYLTPDEVKTFENQILNGVGTAKSIGRQRDWKYRDLLLFRIPVINGLRVTALSEINVEDIDFINKKIMVTEKGNITKKVDFDQKTSQYLRIWLKQRAELNNGIATGPLFISNRRTRMTVRAIENVYKKYSICIDGKNVTPHTGRRTCGTNSYQVTHDIKLVSEILGHTTTAPTRRYVAVLEEDKTAAINKLASLY